MNFIKGIGLGMINDATSSIKNGLTNTVRHNLGITITYPQVMQFETYSVSRIIENWVMMRIPKNIKDVKITGDRRKNSLQAKIGINNRSKHTVKLDNFTYMVYEPFASSSSTGRDGEIINTPICKLSIMGLNYGLHYAKLCKYIDKEVTRINKTSHHRRSISVTSISKGCSSTSFEKGRSRETIYGDHVKKLFDGVEGWMMSKDIYEDLEIPYKLGILLLGPPGTGKTSVVKALSTELCKNINIISPTLLKDPEKLQSQFNNTITNNIILLEDIDRIIIEHKKSTTDTSDIVGTLLNVLDGVVSVPGSIIIATANEIDELPEAMIRPGRFDLVINVNGIKGDDVLRLVSRYKIKSMNIDLEYIKNHPIGCYDEETGLYNPSKVQNILMGIKTQESIKGIK